ncbi:YdiK family protein [Virgibacillus siamensis]|uniref:YdiK family protein n=1 Tax=Virgibacillus siamensis TaxID=480071 RepID=UPI000987CECE|nr:YdiK family protein [Virgibacillus siamensis]
MKTTPKMMFFIYFILGLLFMFVATRSSDGSIWNFTTIILAVIATLNFGVSLRMLIIHFKLKKKNK